MSHSTMANSQTQQPSAVSSIKPLIACGLIVSLIGLALDFKGVKTLLNDPIAFARAPETNQSISHLAGECTSEITADAQLSRKQLLEILAIPERESKSTIRQIAPTPYCQLSSINIRADAEAIREAYPLAFDPNTTLVILYENDEYAGYRFKH